jgi:hypothetical protein
MESKAKRECEAAGGGDAAAALPALLAPAVAPVAAAVPHMPVQRPTTADVAPQQPAVVSQAAAVRADLPAPPPLFSQPSHCKSCGDISARLEALQVTAQPRLPRACLMLCYRRAR